MAAQTLSKSGRTKRQLEDDRARTIDYDLDEIEAKLQDAVGLVEDIESHRQGNIRMPARATKPGRLITDQLLTRDRMRRLDLAKQLIGLAGRELDFRTLIEQ